jgi:hypothetical protein
MTEYAQREDPGAIEARDFPLIANSPAGRIRGSIHA